MQRRWANIEDVREMERVAYHKNKEDVKARKQAYYHANRDRLLEVKKEYRMKNKDKISRQNRLNYLKRKWQKSQTWSQEAYIKALKFAAAKHLGQLYPGTDWPYIVHLNMVAMEIAAALMHYPELNGNLAVQVALLHDILEDTDTRYDELESRFGSEVADGVLALTKNPDIEKQDRMADSLQRIKKQPKEIWVVKLADRITNLQPPPEQWNKEKRKVYLREARFIYDELKEANDYLAVRLKEKIREYHAYIV